jgi:hypothetical protein
MKTIQASALSVILTTLLVLGGVQFTDTNAYYCEQRAIIMNCERLSSSGITCYNGDVGNKRCYEGWAKIQNDIVVEGDTVKDHLSNYDIEITANNKHWKCQSDRQYAKCYSDGYEANYGELVG